MSDPEDRLRIIRAALAEMVPGFDPSMVWQDPWEPAVLRNSPHISRESGVIPKAIRLARLKLDGPDFPMVCDDHNQQSRPDRWTACRRISVSSALLGRTCGAP